MNIRQTVLALAVTLALPSLAQAGGPVLTPEEPVIEGRSEGAALPVIVGVLVLCAILCGGGGDDTPVAAPTEPLCNGGC